MQFDTETQAPSVDPDGRFSAERVRITAENGCPWAGPSCGLARQVRELRFEAEHDALTGLPNRRWFMSRLGSALAEARRTARPLSVGVLDIDGFKSVNDCFGHAEGDALIQAVARHLVHALPEADVARIGGDEFALLWRDGAPQQQLARTLALTHRLSADGLGYNVTLSVGLAGYPAHGVTETGLLHAADLAMYQAKRDGGGRLCQAGNTRRRDEPPHRPAASAVDDTMELVRRHAPIQRRLVRAGQRVYRAGEPFKELHLLNAGSCKLVTVTPEGREQLVSLLQRGDWLGFDGLPTGAHTCDAVALDTGELWTVRYEGLVMAGMREQRLLKTLHRAMVEQAARERELTLAWHLLPADGRVADFLCRWTQALSERGLRTDSLRLPVTRAELGSMLGVRLESVSRALTRLEDQGLIQFEAPSRRDMRIPRLEALQGFVRKMAA